MFLKTLNSSYHMAGKTLSYYLSVHSYKYILISSINMCIAQTKGNLLKYICGSIFSTKSDDKRNWELRTISLLYKVH